MKTWIECIEGEKSNQNQPLIKILKDIKAYKKDLLFAYHKEPWNLKTICIGNQNNETKKATGAWKMHYFARNMPYFARNMTSFIAGQMSHRPFSSPVFSGPYMSPRSGTVPPPIRSSIPRPFLHAKSRPPPGEDVENEAKKVKGFLVLP